METMSRVQLIGLLELLLKLYAVHKECSEGYHKQLLGEVIDEYESLIYDKFKSHIKWIKERTK